MNTQLPKDDLLPRRFVELRLDHKRIFVEVIKDDGSRLSGFRVDKHGTKWAREYKENGKLIEETNLVIFTPSNIVREMRMSKHYGELVKCNAGEWALS